MTIQAGAEVLLSGDCAPLRGARVGLITNPTASVGKSFLADLLAQREDLSLVALFGPEHGVRANAPAGAKIADDRDPVTGIPAYSLFGETKKPLPAMLEGVDWLVFDIQDIGARFYTYISTLGYAMQAAAEAGIPLMVLDRPNPLGGERVEGPILSPDQASFVGLYPIPIVHGLTVGELAVAIQREGWLPGLEKLKLEVIPVQGWKRDQLWPELGRPWIPPSPNIPDFATARVYPGTCLFEGTPVSEGRGTEKPFQIIGAPWADAHELVRSLELAEISGVRFYPRCVRPQSIAGKVARPKFEGEQVQAVEVEVTYPQAFSPVTCGLHLLRAFLEQAPDREAFFHPERFPHLAGTAELSPALLQKQPISQIIASWQEALDEFKRASEQWKLYS